MTLGIETVENLRGVLNSIIHQGLIDKDEGAEPDNEASREP